MEWAPAPEPDPAQQLENEDWADDSSEQLEAGLKGLDERSRSIVQRRWLSSRKATLHELADEYGVSAERIRQIEAAAMKKMKKALAAYA